MPKTTKILSIIVLFLTMGWSTVRAEEVLPLRLQELTDDAYRYYSSRETDDIFEAVNRVKDATEFSQYQET